MGLWEYGLSGVFFQPVLFNMIFFLYKTVLYVILVAQYNNYSSIYSNLLCIPQCMWHRENISSSQSFFKIYRMDL